MKDVKCYRPYTSLLHDGDFVPKVVQSGISTLCLSPKLIAGKFVPLVADG